MAEAKAPGSRQANQVRYHPANTTRPTTRRLSRRFREKSTQEASEGFAYQENPSVSPDEEALSFQTKGANPKGRKSVKRGDEKNISPHGNPQQSTE